MEELKRLRNELGWSQQRLADESGVNKATINQVEQGKRSPSMATLGSLATAMGREVGDFFPKLQAALPFDEPQASRREPEVEEQLLIRVRPLAMLLEEQATCWEHKLAQQGTSPGGGDLDFYEKVHAQREPVLEMLDDLLTSLTAEDGLQWDNPRHRPSRRVQRELQGAFNRWFYAWSAVNDARKNLTGETPRETGEMCVPEWFRKAS